MPTRCKSKKVVVPSIYQQVYFQLREWEQTTTKVQEKYVYYVECDLGNGVYFHTYVAASDKDEAIEQGKARLPKLGEGQYALWTARKKH